jgi:3-hydroxyisobutyrate dehydrogenase-like beta-hydroxyacid dehydrogenase
LTRPILSRENEHANQGDSVSKQILGILHPGQMGIYVAATALNSGCEVRWIARGRSPETLARAEELNLIDGGSLPELCADCDLIVSVCPPHAAVEVATAVSNCHFGGLYLDANAISPAKSVLIGEIVTSGGSTYVDGGIIGNPDPEPGHTWLYLAGQEADRAAACFQAGPLTTKVLGEEIGSASAIKMCFAAWTKGSTALLCTILGAAEKLGIRNELLEQWSQNGSDFAERATGRARRVTAKAWRFAGEMEEIADTFAVAGVPAGFHQGAGDLYQRLSQFKDAASTPEFDEVLEAILNPEAHSAEDS